MAILVTKTDVANKALSALAESALKNNINISQSASAKHLLLHFDSAFQSALMVHDWTFATGYTDGPMVLLRDNPSSGYLYAYQYPKDCLVVRQVALEKQFRNNVDLRPEEEIPFKEVPSEDGLMEVHTNLQYAAAEFTRNIPVEGSYPLSFARVAAAYLALDAGPSIITNNFSKVQNRLELNIEKWKQMAVAEDLLRQSKKQRPLSPFLQARFVT